MAEPDLIHRIMDDIYAIPAPQLSALAEMIHYYRVGIQTEKSQKPHGRFSALCGSMSPENADSMMAAIEEAFGRIDPDG